MRTFTHLVFLFLATAAFSQNVPKDFICIDSFANLKCDLRYAGANNFTGKALYPAGWKCYLHPLAAARLVKAIEILKVREPRLKLVIYDATRPRSVQKKMWETVRGTDRARYISSPRGTSMHNYGLALDCSIIDENGKELDMGCGYDEFTERAEPRHEKRHLREGKLTTEQYLNRRFLRDVMLKAGLRPIQNEWWHFEAVRKTELRGRFQVVE